MTTVEKAPIREAYNDVRDDNSDINWAVLKYNGNAIDLDSKGTEYDEFKSKFSDDERAYGFIRIITGDELSKRAKFAFITWVGHSVSPLKKAKMSTDKAFVKEVIQNFAVEILTSEKEDVDVDHIKQKVIKAGGANYGTGR